MLRLLHITFAENLNPTSLRRLLMSKMKDLELSLRERYRWLVAAEFEGTGIALSNAAGTRIFVDLSGCQTVTDILTAIEKQLHNYGELHD